MENLGSHRRDFHETSYLSVFPKSVGENSVFIKIGQETGTLHENHYTFFIISCSAFLRMINVSYKFVEKIETFPTY